MGDVALLFLRLVVSLSMIGGHGIGKVMNMSGYVNFIETIFRLGPLSPFLAFMSILAETLFQVLILLGLFTRISSLIAAINMFVAVFVFHILIRGDNFSVFEKPLLYMVIYIFLALAGAGKYSIDEVIRRR